MFYIQYCIFLTVFKEIGVGIYIWPHRKGSCNAIFSDGSIYWRVHKVVPLSNWLLLRPLKEIPCLWSSVNAVLRRSRSACLLSCSLQYILCRWARGSLWAMFKYVSPCFKPFGPFPLLRQTILTLNVVAMHFKTVCSDLKRGISYFRDWLHLTYKPLILFG